MSTPEHNQNYRVAFVEWTSWEVSVDASSEAEALAEAETIWADDDGSCLKIRDSGTEEWEVMS